MLTIPTDTAGATQTLLERVAPFSSKAVIPMCQIQELATELLPDTPLDEATLAVLQIAEALTNVELFESTDKNWLQMWGGTSRVDALQWGYERAERWRQLAYMTAANAVEANSFHANKVA